MRTSAGSRHAHDATSTHIDRVTTIAVVAGVTLGAIVGGWIGLGFGHGRLVVCATSVQDSATRLIGRVPSTGESNTTTSPRTGVEPAPSFTRVNGARQPSAWFVHEHPIARGQGVLHGTARHHVVVRQRRPRREQAQYASAAGASMSSSLLAPG